MYEIMKMSPALKRVISKREGAERLKEQAMAEGVRSLRISATEYVIGCITSFSEMMRVSFEE